MHIIPAAGSATRMGGIPKYLLPTNLNADPIIKFHLQMAQEAELGCAVLTHPSMTQYVGELISNWRFSNVHVLPLLSKSMTFTVIEAIKLFHSNHDVFSISMPDTYFEDSNGFSAEFLLQLRGNAPSLGLWRIQDSQIGKLGQVDIDFDSMRVVKMVDKNPLCDFKFSWGMMALNGQAIQSLHEDDAHPGISFEKLIDHEFISSSLATGSYIDCGTPSEYFSFLSTRFPSI